MSQTSPQQFEQPESTANYPQQFQPQSQYQPQQPVQQATQPPVQQGQQRGGQLPQAYREILGAVAQSVELAGWCADQCIKTADQNMSECIRLCEDVVELGETLLAIAPRSSQFTADVARTFEQAAQVCAQECGQHAAAHCQECAAVLQATIPSVQQLSAMGNQQAGGVTRQQF